jgi:hypothetical protein
VSTLLFNARFAPTNSLQLTTTSWTVDADLFDGLGMFSAFDVQVNDVVYLDCFSSFSFPGTVNRYKVTQINARSGMQINCDLVWDDNSEGIVDIGEIIGNSGFICRPSTNKQMAFHAAPTIHNIPDYVVQYSRNNDNSLILDPFGNKRVFNATGVTIGQYKVVAWEDNGTVNLADATLHDLSDVAGITLQAIPDGQFGWIIKKGYVAGALAGMNAKPGDNIILSPTNPGEMTKTAITDLNVSIISLGRAEPPSGIVSPNAIDLHMELSIEQEI